MSTASSRGRFGRFALILCLVLIGPVGARAQGGPIQVNLGNILGASLKNNVNGALSMLNYSVLPGAAATSVQLSTGSTGKPGLSMSNIGDGFTFSDDFPLYLEGFIGWSRYDPTFVFEDPGSKLISRLRGDFNSLAANGGIGWDFKLDEHWVLRPIIDLTLGAVASDSRLAGAYLNYKYNINLAFLRRGGMTAAGGGASLVLAYYLRSDDLDVDFEARSTNGYLQSFGGTSQAVQGDTQSHAISTWTRLRWPTGIEIFDRPFRYVVQEQNSWFMDQQAKALGFSALYSVGAGLETDLSAHEIGAFGFNLQRLRILGSYFFGHNVSGWSVGIGMSF